MFPLFQQLEDRMKTMPEGDDKMKCQMILEHANVNS